MLNVLDSEYVKLARAKGVSARDIVWKHAFRNAILPVFTFSGLTLASLLTGMYLMNHRSGTNGTP
jgi:ABC-type dipeptide/oligopeptide/nickel transport system permease component